MDQYLKILQNDVRLLRRENRNGVILNEEIEKRLADLPDSIDEATWLNPDGTRCDEETNERLKRYHIEGLEAVLAEEEDLEETPQQTQSTEETTPEETTTEETKSTKSTKSSKSTKSTKSHK